MKLNIPTAIALDAISSEDIINDYKKMYKTENVKIENVEKYSHHLKEICTYTCLIVNGEIIESCTDFFHLRKRLFFSF